MDAYQVVDRYLARALPGDVEAPARVLLRQEGTFRLWEGVLGWRPFDAVERVELDPPAFEWGARIRVAPLVTVRVRDGYRGGEGHMRARLGGLVTLVDHADDADLAAGALSRFLAEAPWFPWRLRPGPRLRWGAPDGSHATATLRDRGHEVSVRFGFDASGDVVEARAVRKRWVGDGAVDTRWHATFGEHRELGGVRIPTVGEVAWVLDGAERPYWRGRITALEPGGVDE